MKILELNSTHIYRKVKVSWTTARKNGKYHEYYIKIESIHHYHHTSMVAGRPYKAASMQTSERLIWGYNGTPLGVPYYADVELIDD